MSKINQNRSELRGKKLDRDCHGATISTNECGWDDDRKFCLGLNDASTDCLLEKCIDCGAHVSNAEFAAEREEKEMENILLFNTEIDPREILSSRPNLVLNVNAYNYMTNKESEKIQQLLADASQIVMTTLIRRLNEEREE